MEFTLRGKRTVGGRLVEPGSYGGEKLQTVAIWRKGEEKASVPVFGEREVISVFLNERGGGECTGNILS